jgi:hypothetical protein
MNAPLDPPAPEPYNPLTPKLKRRKKNSKVKKDDSIKMGCIWIERRQVIFDF